MPGPTIRSVDGARALDGLAPRPRIVVVGMGHGGMTCVQALAREPADVLVVDRNNYHTFQPLLYQVATAGLDVDDVTQPARHILRGQANVDFRYATVTGADLDARVLHVDAGLPIPYDVLVLAAGATTATYGVDGVDAHAFPLKSARQALDLRSHVLAQFEAANEDPALIEEGALTVVVVGGGATGVEMSGALTELFHRVLRKDFPALDVSRARVVLVEGGDALMAGYANPLRAYTRRALERRGVEVRLEAQVERVDPAGVTLADGTRIPARTVVWAAGVQAVPLAATLGLETTRGGRIVVGDDLRMPGRPEVFVVGDLAGATDAGGALYPQVAQVAIQQGRHVARQIARDRAGLATEPFAYHDLGMMATIGRNAAILQLPSGFTLTGWLAWLGWLFVHVLALVGFRNRVSVLLSWVYNYLTYDRGPRLILRPSATSDDATRSLPEEDASEPDRKH